MKSRCKLYRNIFSFASQSAASQVVDFQICNEKNQIEYSHRPNMRIKDLIIILT